MFSQPLQELYNNSLVIIISIITPMMIDSIKQYLHKDQVAHSKKNIELHHKGKKNRKQRGLTMIMFLFIIKD
jgi:hypothetical protein